MINLSKEREENKMICAAEAREIAIGKQSESLNRISSDIKRVARDGKTKMYCHPSGDKVAIAHELEKYGYRTRINEKSITIMW